jgi:hypothetical protein
LFAPAVIFTAKISDFAGILTGIFVFVLRNCVGSVINNDGGGETVATKQNRKGGIDDA